MAPKVPSRPPVRHPRASRPNLNRAAILAAATELFATSGPAAVSIREIATRAGCSHTLIGQQFGSKKGLETAVIKATMEEFTDFSSQVFAEAEISYAALIEWIREHDSTLRLLSRFALGEFEGTNWRSDSPFGTTLIGSLQQHRATADINAAEETKIVAFAILATILGHFSQDQFLCRASRTMEVPAPRRDELLAEAAQLIASLPGSGLVKLHASGARVVGPPEQPPDLTVIDSRSALVQATILLYASHGPAALTTREIADLARVNQGLIYHYFESREALLDEAITEANAPFLASLPLNPPIDLLPVLRAVYRTPTHRMLVRLQANGVPIEKVRTRFPVFDSLLATFPHVPSGPESDGLKDPRIALMLAGSLTFGAALWDGPLRDMLGISQETDLIPALAELMQFIFDFPRS
jgi:AcrR family transcriptional regulator